ncbi:SCO family protein [Pelistega sp. NLN82]|uniref:SCO family protein n=1 Tax=Pelistega ratti TaxID=2652177 RepID=A0A6L9Y689_9BURK|nr:SCO family protein [Pelistega ratti]NEN75980.1 SCO family protein [Pelistega ratti]
MFARIFPRLVLTFFISIIALGQVAHARSISFDLEDYKGKVTEKSYPGKYLLVSIGYSSCPDICPTTLSEYALTLETLKNPETIAPIFVSIDPVHDTPEILHTYVTQFDERIIGLSGDLPRIKALTDQLGASFGYRLDGKRIEVPQKGTDYTVYHSSLIYLINPEHQLLDVFDYQIGAEDLAQSIDAILAKEATQQKTQ